jgi:hypothetical protein
LADNRAVVVQSAAVHTFQTNGERLQGAILTPTAFKFLSVNSEEPEMISVLLRLVAFLIGFLLVVGGGICTGIGLPVGVLTLSDSVIDGLDILFRTAIGFGILCIGMWMIKLSLKSKLGDEPKP